MLRAVSAFFLVSVFSLCVQAELTKVATMSAEVPPGNIAIGPEGRVFLSVHEFFGKPLKVVELMADGTTRPYPTARWSKTPDAQNIGLNGVLGLNVSRDGILWMLDDATETGTPRLIGWDTKKEQLHRIVYLSAPATVPTSFINDLAIDDKNNAIYIADMASPDTAALIIVDLNTGETRRVLQASAFTRPDDADMIIDGRLIKLGGQPARIGVNPITIDANSEWLYFGAMSGLSVYRIKTTDLLNREFSSEQLASRVQRYGGKPISDGITIDNAGNVYITSITDNSIGITKPDGSYQTLYQNDDLSWPDGMAVGPDNQIFFTVNELHLSPVINEGEDATTGKFAVYKFTALAPAVTGR